MAVKKITRKIKKKPRNGWLSSKRILMLFLIALSIMPSTPTLVVHPFERILFLVVLVALFFSNEL